MLGMPTPLNISLVPLLPWCQGPSNFIPLQTFHPSFHMIFFKTQSYFLFCFSKTRSEELKVKYFQLRERTKLQTT